MPRRKVSMLRYQRPLKAWITMLYHQDMHHSTQKVSVLFVCFFNFSCNGTWHNVWYWILTSYIFLATQMVWVNTAPSGKKLKQTNKQKKTQETKQKICQVLTLGNLVVRENYFSHNIVLALGYKEPNVYDNPCGRINLHPIKCEKVHF